MQEKLKHSVSYIFRPWALSFHEIVEFIGDDSTRLIRKKLGGYEFRIRDNALGEPEASRLHND